MFSVTLTDGRYLDFNKKCNELEKVFDNFIAFKYKNNGKNVIISIIPKSNIDIIRNISVEESIESIDKIEEIK